MDGMGKVGSMGTRVSSSLAYEDWKDGIVQGCLER